MSGMPTKNDDIGSAVANPPQYTALAWLKSIANSLLSIGSDTTPVAVTSNIKSGSYAFTGTATNGAPSVTASNAVARSNAFVPTGEKITVNFGAYLTGNRVMSSNDGYVYLECDPSGGTVYVPLAGTKINFSDLPDWANNKSFCAVWAVRGGNCRIVINFGTITGTTGVVGYNLGLLN